MYTVQSMSDSGLPDLTEFDDYMEALALANDLANNGIDSSIMITVRHIEAGKPVPLDLFNGVIPGRDYPFTLQRSASWT